MAGWDWLAQQQRAEEVYQRNLQNVAEKLPLNQATFKPQLDDTRATTNQNVSVSIFVVCMYVLIKA